MSDKVGVGDVVELGGDSRYGRMLGIVNEVREWGLIVIMRVALMSDDKAALDCPIRVKTGDFRVIARGV